MKSFFSLVELLIVIAILAVLISLLSPSLKQTMHKAKVLQCSNNYKSFGVSTVLYTDDYNELYVNHMGVGEPRINYNGIDYLQGLSGDPSIVYMMLPYMGSGTDKNDWWDIVICPFVDEEEIWPTTHNGRCRAPRYYRPSMPMHTYWNVGGFRAGEMGAKMMMRYGDTWNWGDSPNSSGGEQSRWFNGPQEAVHYEYNIVAADKLLDQTFYSLNPRGNYTVTNHNPPGYQGQKSGGGTAGYYSIYSAAFEYEANYLFDDGSVRFYEGIEHRPPSESDFLRFNRGGWVPVEAGK